MKKLILIFAFIASFAFNIEAQKNEELKFFNENKHLFEVTPNDEIVFTRIFENLNAPKDTLYKRATMFFAENEKNFFLFENAEAGFIITQSRVLLVSTMWNFKSDISTTQTLRIDVKDNRCRAIASIRYYEMDWGARDGDHLIVNTNPFTDKPKPSNKNKQLEAINNYIKYIQKEFDNLNEYLQTQTLLTNTAEIKEK